MPIHDWTRVEAGIFHDFHQGWIVEIARVLNRQLLPPEYYALKEQVAAGANPDVLTLQLQDPSDNGGGTTQALPSSTATLQLAAPSLPVTAETDLAWYRRKQTVIAIRHVSGDRIVAVVELVSPGNKSARNPLRAFVEKSAELLFSGIHLLIVDLFPPGRRDPQGIHGEIWQDVAGKDYTAPADRPLTLVAYEAGPSVRAYVVPMTVGETLVDMPLFLEPGQAVTVPLEATYGATFADVPRRWQRVLEAPQS